MNNRANEHLTPFGTHIEVIECPECGGNHEPSGARSDCIRHWKRRAILAENEVIVCRIYGKAFKPMPMIQELREWLKQAGVTTENIGEIRRRCFMPWDSEWNAIVRDETAAVENKSK